MSARSVEPSKNSLPKNAAEESNSNENLPTSVVNVANSKPGFLDLNGIEPTPNDPTAPAPVVYKRGWKNAVKKDVAISNTLKEVAKNYPGRTIMGDPEIVESDDHRKNGEYLVKVLIV